MKHRSLWTQAPPLSCTAVRFCAYWRGRSIRYQTLKLRIYGNLLPFLSYSLKHLVHYYTDFFYLWIWGFHIMLLSILMCRVTLVNHCQEGTSIGKFAYVCFSPKKPCCWYPWGGSWYQDTQEEKWGSSWDQSTDSVSQADTEFVQHIQNPWASLVATIRSDRHIYKIVEMKFWKNHKTWQVLSFSWIPPNSICKNSLFTLLQLAGKLKQKKLLHYWWRHLSYWIAHAKLKSFKREACVCKNQFDKMILHYDIHQSCIRTTHTMLSTCTRIKKSQLMKNLSLCLSLWVLELCHSC